VARPDWGVILPAYARCVRITRGRKEKFTVKPEALVEEAERKLYEAVNTQPSSFDGDVEALLNAVVALIPFINTFFDKVLVMAEEQSVRENRLGLLQRIAGMADGVADLSKLEGF
jgi:glycyl-tRNA synthetase